VTVLEIAELRIQPGTDDAFLDNARQGIDLFQRASGCDAMQIRRSVELPGEYRLLARWKTLEAHTVDFRNSGEFHAWRGLIADFLADQPTIGNWGVALPGFGFSH
jgi:quinol monooxygenase YgiN